MSEEARDKLQQFLQSLQTGDIVHLHWWNSMSLCETYGEVVSISKQKGEVKSIMVAYSWENSAGCMRHGSYLINSYSIERERPYLLAYRPKAD